MYILRYKVDMIIINKRPPTFCKTLLQQVLTLFFSYISISYLIEKTAFGEKVIFWEWSKGFSLGFFKCLISSFFCRMEAVQTVGNKFNVLVLYNHFFFSLMFYYSLRRNLFSKVSYSWNLKHMKNITNQHTI